MATTQAPRTEDRPLDWGMERSMNALEALMWRAEADPRLRSTVVGVEVLEHAPDWERLHAAHEWATRMVPRLRQRVVEPPLGLGAPTWIVDPDFDLDYHLRRVKLADASYTALFELAQTFAMTPFDKARAQWEALVVEGLPDGRAAFVLKLHHALADGKGIVELLAGLHSRRAEHTPNKPQPPVPSGEQPDHARALARQVAADANALARAARGGLGRLRRPDKAVRDAAEFTSSLGRVLADPPAAPSPLLAQRSMSWRFVALDCRFADLRGASKAHDCSLNDAFIAALMGAFRIYHERHGQPITAIPMNMPISIRKADDAGGGNKFAAARLAGPVSITDPVERMREVQRQVGAARAEPAMDGLAIVAPALSRLPGPVIARLAGGTTKGVDLQASNVPGLREDVFLAGARIERVYPFAPLPGCAAMIALTSHGDTCCIGANLDAASFTDLDGFAQDLCAGFDEVLALHPGSAPAVLRT